MFRQAAVLLLTVLAVQPALGQRQELASARAAAVLWTDPGAIKSRDLYWGPGRKQHQPRGPIRFVKEDTKGNSPKLDVRDGDGKHWRAKLGVEAQAETAATRIIWAIGYTANETYFFPDLKVEDLPQRLKRGQGHIGPGGNVHDVRLQSRPYHDKKAGNWEWRKNPFYGTREFNGLRVVMALISNWDLKTENNAVVEDKDSGRTLYEVSDVGTSFGKNGQSYTEAGAKGNPEAYAHSRFIAKVTPEYVDFNCPARLPLIYIFHFPRFLGVLRSRWIGKHIPRQDVRWVASLLAQLSPEQIRDAFRAAGYPPETVEAFGVALQKRIAELSRL